MSEAAQSPKERKITSPEELHDYIHVTGPKLWVLLTMIIILLVSLFFLASTIKMENTLNARVNIVDDGETGHSSTLECTLTDERKDLVRAGMKVRVAGEEGTVRMIVQDGDSVFVTITLDRENAKLKEGFYDAKIVLESTTPVSFLLDRMTGGDSSD